VRDQFVDFFEGAGIEQEIDALARRQLACGVLLVEAVLAAAQFRAAFEIGERVVGFQAFTACAFSQSLRNFSSPMFVSGWLNS
jgi:hypothetical protein